MTDITKLCLLYGHYLHCTFYSRNWTFTLLNKLLENNTSNLDSDSKLRDLTSMTKVLNLELFRYH